MLKSIRDFQGATIFAYHVDNPENFGVVEFDKKGNVISIEEKPKDPKSNYAVPGLYFYDNNVIDLAKSITPSNRGELEITEINRMYLKASKLKVEILKSGIVWLDTGTYYNLMKASELVEMVQNTMGIHVGCIEEVAYRKGYIDEIQFNKIIDSILGNEYKKYLKKCLICKEK